MSRMKRSAYTFFLTLIFAGLAGGLFYRFRQKQITDFAATPFDVGDSKKVDVLKGTGPKALAALLRAQGVVSSDSNLYAYIRRENLGPRLKAGEYEFSGALTPKEVLDHVVGGQVKTYRFTIPEGLRVEEILPIIAVSELQPDLQKLTQLAENPAFLKRAQVPASRVEGFLYPDTYVFTRNTKEEDMLLKMIGRSLEEYRNADAVRQQGITLNLLQTMTLASIIEKETGQPQERPHISCVFHNRLRLGMKLQTDPTVLYAMRMLRGVFVKNITSKDLLTDHPYNTYTRTQLPPGPIANPGSEAILAALNPSKCDDLFFVSRNDGTHIFCPTLGCHNRAVEQWQRQYFKKKK